jgi:hypothetical protein
MPVPGGEERHKLLYDNALHAANVPEPARGAPAEMRGSTQNARPNWLKIRRHAGGPFHSFVSNQLSPTPISTTKGTESTAAFCI